MLIKTKNYGEIRVVGTVGTLVSDSAHDEKKIKPSDPKRIFFPYIPEGGKYPSQPSQPETNGTTTGTPSTGSDTCTTVIDDPPAFQVWNQVDGCIGSFVGLDTETERIQEDDPAYIPRLVLGSAYNKETGGWIIPPEEMSAFLEVHRKTKLVLHNAPFDWGVIRRACGMNLCDWLDAGLLMDSGILYRLVKLAETGRVPDKWSLEQVAAEVAGITLDKAEDVRLGFGQFLREDGPVDLKAIPDKFLVYAIEDAEATTMVAERLLDRLKSACQRYKVDPAMLLAHDCHLKAALALEQVSMNGLHLNQPRLQRIKAEIVSRQQNLRQRLDKEYDYRSGKGSNKRYQAIMEGIEKDLGLQFPRTDKSGDISSRAEDLMPCGARSPFIVLYLDYKSAEHMLSTSVKPLDGKDKVHPRFNAILTTGRTSSHSPNCQQIPREGGFRECFIPSPGYEFLDLDYCYVELVALAQICLHRYGKSKLAEVIRAGTDPHTWLAAQLTCKEIAAVTKAERTSAKAVGFGYPGGLGIKAFIEYAKSTFSIEFTEEQAQTFKEKWMTAYPEMHDYLDGRQDDEQVIRNYDLDANPLGWDSNIMNGVFRRVISGVTDSTTGNPYPPEILDFCWECLNKFPPAYLKEFSEIIARRTGSPDLAKTACSVVPVILNNGFIRPFCGFTQARNMPFQGTAAAGAKAALYRLVREGFRVVNFCHDEFLIEVPATLSPEEHLAIARRVEKIMIEAMQREVPDVPVKVEFALMDRWSKDAKPMFDDPKSPSQLLVWHADGP